MRGRVNKDRDCERIVYAVTDDRLKDYTSAAEAFAPSEACPELGYTPIGDHTEVYALLRRLLETAGLDDEHRGSSTWNPLADVIGHGRRVVLKPNWVCHYNKAGLGLDCLITHASLVRSVLDYVLLTEPLQVVVGDAPLQGCDLDQLLTAGGYKILQKYYAHLGSPVEWVDFRRTILDDTSLLKRRYTNQRSLANFILVDMGKESLLEPIAQDADRFRVTMYDPEAMRQTHQHGVHQYLIAREVLEADVVINLPKLKTHCKAAITGALKNLVGINGNKDYLPHHRKGGSNRGGDCYIGDSRLKHWVEDLLDAMNRRTGWSEMLLRKGASVALKLAQLQGMDSNIEGSWYGNDTVWRMSLDLDRLLLYARLDGTLADTPQRIVLTITDAIIAGEGEGPLAPHPRPLGMLTLARNLAAADYFHAHVMGFDWEKMPIVRESFTSFSYPIANFSPSDIVLVKNGVRIEQPWHESIRPAFIPPRGWLGHCEQTEHPALETHYELS